MRNTRYSDSRRVLRWMTAILSVILALSMVVGIFLMFLYN